MRASCSKTVDASSVLDPPERPLDLKVNWHSELPLVVDLDGTLIRTDLLIESLLVLVKRRPLLLPAAASWLAHGRAYLKRRLAREVAPDIATLPYNSGLISLLKAEKQKAREIVLATGADDCLAEKVADHLGLFDRVFASDGITNLSGEIKRDRLVAEYGLAGFDYVGDGRRDGAVRAAARLAISVPDGEEPRPFDDDCARHRAARIKPSPIAACLTALRPHQWLKNLLVFAPLLFAHRLGDLQLLLRGLIAFASFSFCASGGYVFNDLMDLGSDRHHPQKKNRPLASGRLPVVLALVLMPVLPLTGFALGLSLPGRFIIALAAYYALTLTYSLRLKNVAVVDVLTLAGLYALRVLGGALAAGLPLPTWLLGFCVFLFLSLALIKRYAELLTMHSIDGALTHARAYLYEDREILAALGTASGYVAVLLLGLHIGTRSSQPTSVVSQLAWCSCLLLLYWISHMWLMAHRGRVVDDPLAFALQDRASQVMMLLLPGVFIAMAHP